MSAKFIVITDDDQILLKDYKEGCGAISEIVDGCIGHFFTDEVNLNGRNDITVDFWCNDEFLYRDDYQKYNALASSLSGATVYGPVVLDVLDDELEGTSRGFTEAEASYFQKLLEVTVKINQGRIRQMHERYDFNKPEPRFEFVTQTVPKKDDFER
jgi:hypothetical protein